MRRSSSLARSSLLETGTGGIVCGGKTRLLGATYHPDRVE